MNSIKRCTWLDLDKPDYIDYHDNEWGIATYDDRLLFEILTLEGAQAGLNWYLILKKRDHYRKLFHKFDVNKLASLADKELENILQNKNIIRNRLKVFSVRTNARVILDIQNEYDSFANYLWKFVDNKQIINKYNYIHEIPASTNLSDRISKDLKKRGMKFVGSKIIYAFMQASGLVNDHLNDCVFKYKKPL